MGRTEEVMITFGVSLLFLPLLTGFAEAQCEISVKNVGHEPFTWHMEYADGWIYERNLTYGAHDNFECACVPHDMKIIYQDYYCYHYMNCVHNYDYEVDITEYAIYINVGHDNVEICTLCIVLKIQL